MLQQSVYVSVNIVLIDTGTSMTRTSWDHENLFEIWVLRATEG